MVEVCTSFKCAPRTYFLAATIFDKYLVAMHQTGHSLSNKVIHSIGVTSMYMASKYEDVFPLHSKVVSEKIAHGSISAKEVVAREHEFLNLFDFNTDFVTHFDFLQTYNDKIEKQLLYNLKNSNVSPAFAETCTELLHKLAEMGLLLTKMAVQCVEFCPYSPSVLVLASLYASTAFLKHSQQYHSDETTRFCSEVRQIIFEIHQEELNQQSGFLNRFQKQHPEITDMHMNIYQNQFS